MQKKYYSVRTILARTLFSTTCRGRGWVLSLRLKPLVVGIGPVLLGIAVARWAEPHSAFDWLLNIAIVFCVILIQTATHFFNDALDFLKGADSSLRLGPKRAVQTGLIKPSQLITAGVVCLLMAGLIGFYLVKQGGWPVFLVGSISLLLAYLYTGGPWPLAYTGWADLFVLLFFGLLPVGLVFYLNTGYFSEWAWIAGLQCGFLALSVFVVNNLRDAEADKKAGKKTLIVRFGRGFGLWEGRGALFLPYLIGMWWLGGGFWPAGLYPFLLSPFFFYVHRLLQRALEGEPTLDRSLPAGAVAGRLNLAGARLFSRLFSVVCLHYAGFVLLLFLAFCFAPTT